MEGETEAMAITHGDDDEGSSSGAVPMAVASVDMAEGSHDSAEEKRLKRMRRNRESAAMSRNRKKQYVEELEARVAALNETVQSLHSENFELRREHARLLGKPMPTAPTAVAVMAPVSIGDGDGSTDLGADGDVVDHPATLPSSAAGVAPSPRASDALLGLELLSRSASIGGDGATKHDSGSVGGDECHGLVAAEAAVAVADAGDAIPIASVEPAPAYSIAPDDDTGSASHPASDSAASHPPSDSAATVGSASVEAM